MKKSSYSSSHTGGPFNTLAYNRTNDHLIYPYKPNIVVRGKGIEVDDTSALKARVRKKMMADYLMPLLVDIARENGDNDMIQSYWNTYHCQRKLYSSKGRLYAPYCKNRFCTICLGIRKANMIHKYLPVVKSWEEPYFLTLTMKAIPLSQLNKRIARMTTTFSNIIMKYRKRNYRGKDIKLVGIRSLECNYNPVKKTYNPHFHLIVPNSEIAMKIKRNWVESFDSRLVLNSNQKATKINNNVKCLIEVFKYGCKIFTDPEMKKRNQRSKPPIIYAAALHQIYKALKPYDVTTKFGFKLPKTINCVKSSTQIISNYTEMVYHSYTNDWVNIDTGHQITGYIPTGQLHFLLANNIDTINE